MENKKIVLGMSGGVDSSVCAYLLKKNKYDVIGLFMQNWDTYVNYDFKGQVDKPDKQCNAQKDFNDAKAVADKLGIKIYRTEFINEYWNEVFTYLITEYKKGNTPNPDVLCNKFIKFDHFIKYAKNELNCEKIAMGHYANVKQIGNKFYLTKSVTEDKDQTYFLCWLNQEQLSKVVFPIGNLNKDEVRKIAHEQGLINWNKKDSTGICFIGERKFKDFLQNYIKVKEGNIVDILTKKKVGTHQGIMFYTYGQNKTLGLSGCENKYFVCGKDIQKNILYVVDSIHKEEYLSSTKCEVEQFNWINDPNEWIGKTVQVRFRHRMPLINAEFKIVGDKVLLHHDKTLSVTPGQFAVLYYKEFCLGGGIVCKTNKKQF